MKLISCLNPVTYKVDASQYFYGRLCCHIAKIIANKFSVYEPSDEVRNFVEILNIHKVKFSSKSKADKHIKFYRHSRYPGGFKTRSLKYYIERGMLESYFKKGVARMLGKNQFYKKALKQNIIFV